MMEQILVRSVFEELAEFLATSPTPEAIIAYRLPEALEERAHYLLDLNGEGELTPEQRDEMMDFGRIQNLMMLLKIKMRIGIGEYPC